MTRRCRLCRGVLDQCALLNAVDVCTSCAIKAIHASRQGTRAKVTATRLRDAGQSAASQAPDEWAVLVAAVNKVAAEHDGEVDWTHVRPIIRGRIEPKHVGTLVRRARREGLLIEDHFHRSEDVVGKNAGRMEPKYRIGTTAQEAVA